jgi:hypothetical protein
VSPVTKRTPRIKATALGGELRATADQYEAHALAYQNGTGGRKVDPRMAFISMGRAEGLRDAAARVDAANGTVPWRAPSEPIESHHHPEPSPPSFGMLVARIERLERALLREAPAILRPSEASHAPAAARPPLAAPERRGSPRTVEDPLSSMERKILTALAQVGPTSEDVVLLLTGYSPSGPFTGAMARLRADGLLVGGAAALHITPEGLALLGDFERLPQGSALIDHWERKLGKMAGAILRLAVLNPEGRAEEWVLAALHYKHSGPWTGALAKLRKLSILAPRGFIRPTQEFLSLVQGDAAAT